MTEKRVQIEVRFELDLREDEVWPDGAPDEWTAEDVLAGITNYGSLNRFMSDWNVTASGAEVDIWVDMDHARGFLR